MWKRVTILVFVLILISGCVLFQPEKKPEVPQNPPSEYELFSYLPLNNATDAIFLDIKEDSFVNSSSVNYASKNLSIELEEAQLAYYAYGNGTSAAVLRLKTKNETGDIVREIKNKFGADPYKIDIKNETEMIDGKEVTLLYLERDNPVCAWRDGEWLYLMSYDLRLSAMSILNSMSSVYNGPIKSNMSCEKMFGSKYDTGRAEEIFNESAQMETAVGTHGESLGYGMVHIEVLNTSIYFVNFDDENSSSLLVVAKGGRYESEFCKEVSDPYYNERGTIEVLRSGTKTICRRINYPIDLSLLKFSPPLSLERRIGDYVILLAAYSKNESLNNIRMISPGYEDIVFGINLTGEEKTVPPAPSPTAEEDSASYWSGTDVGIVRYYISARSGASQMVLRNNRLFGINLTEIALDGGNNVLSYTNGVTLLPGSSVSVNLTTSGCGTPGEVFSRNVTIGYVDATYGVGYAFTGEKPLVGICQE